MESQSSSPSLGSKDEHATTIEAAAHALGALFTEAQVCESHGLAHALDVLRIVRRALRCCTYALTPAQRLAVQLAALLHDADDLKNFPESTGYQNARAVLAKLSAQLGGEQPEPLPGDLVELVIRMIGWVSASTNHDAIPTEAGSAPWLLYPRYADRLTAVGWTGVYRCWKYTLGVARPLFTPETPRATSEEDLWERIATRDRYAAYHGVSPSMIDHYYDKLLHIGLPLLELENAYLRGEAKRRSAPLVEVALTFGREGKLPDGMYEAARRAAEKETEGGDL